MNHASAVTEEVSRPDGYSSADLLFALDLLPVSLSLPSRSDVTPGLPISDLSAVVASDRRSSMRKSQTAVWILLRGFVFVGRKVNI